MSPSLTPSAYILQEKKAAQVKSQLHRLFNQLPHSAQPSMVIDEDGVIVAGSTRRVVAHLYAQDHSVQYQDLTEAYLGISNPAQLFFVGDCYYIVVDVLKGQSPHVAQATIERAAANYAIGVQHLNQQAVLDFQQQLQQDVDQAVVAPAIVTQWPIELSLDWLAPWHTAGGALSIVARSLSQSKVNNFVDELNQLQQDLGNAERKSGYIDFAQQKKFERGIDLYTQWQRSECRITQTTVSFHHVGDRQHVVQQQDALASIAQSSGICIEPLPIKPSHDPLDPVPLTTPCSQPLLNSRMIDCMLMQPAIAMPF